MIQNEILQLELENNPGINLLFTSLFTFSFIYLFIRLILSIL